MTCPMCGSPRPAERWCSTPGSAGYLGEGTWRGFHKVGFCCTSCNNPYHNQILSSEERERVLPAEY